MISGISLEALLFTSPGELPSDHARHGVGTPAIMVTGEIVWMRTRPSCLLPHLAEETVSSPPP